jgi:phosphoribosyl-AMP cyclohydrolase
MELINLPADLLARLSDPASLVPVIAQDANSDKVLMLAYMNKAALEQTIITNFATYWSRSRNELWVKGATSGHLQEVTSISIDCDSDAILLKVIQTGVACHTGEETCFHNHLHSE